MKKMIAMLILGVLFTFCASPKNDITLQLIFPNPAQKICLVKATDKNGDLLTGQKLPTDSPLAKKILEELNLPFHYSVIKLSQCSRNFVSDHQGPNVLYLSQTEGGFPRQGLILKDGDEIFKYPDLGYVDLVIDEQRLALGILHIFSHELGHVMMSNIWKSIPGKRSTKQHASMGVTDYTTAIIEGWGIHFQRLAYDSIPRYKAAFDSSYDYSRSHARLWHSNIDSMLRLYAVLNNDYIHQKLLPEVNISCLGLEEMILLEHASPIFDKTRLKNAQQMLSCEGVLATLFHRINTNKVLQNNYLDKTFYNHFLLAPIPDNLRPQDLFTPFENVVLKHFWVWSRLEGRMTEESTLCTEYVKEWGRSFTKDKEEILKLFIMSTVGKTVSSELGTVYEEMAYFGIVGNRKMFKKLLKDFQNTADTVIKKVLDEELDITANVGPQIWIMNKKFLIRQLLWNPSRTKPLAVNLNTASAYDLACFPGVNLDLARKILNKRDELGYFKSIEEAKAVGFKYN